MADDTDYTLLTQLNTGNHKAFEALYYKYSPKLYNFISSCLHDKTQAKDITQHCFLKIWEKKDLIDANGNFVAYLFTIARNEIYKETERKIKLILQKDFFQNELHIDEDIIDSLDANIIENYLNELIERLASSQKRIFILKKENTFTNKEIAEMLNISEKTVETQILRARKYLKDELNNLLRTKK